MGTLFIMISPIGIVITNATISHAAAIQSPDSYEPTNTKYSKVTRHPCPLGLFSRITINVLPPRIHTTRTAPALPIPGQPGADTGLNGAPSGKNFDRPCIGSTFAIIGPQRLIVKLSAVPNQGDVKVPDDRVESSMSTVVSI